MFKSKEASLNMKAMIRAKDMAFKILFGEDCDLNLTWQKEFPEKETCKTCGGEAIPAIQVSDAGKTVDNIPEDIVNDRKKGLSRIWPHDSLVTMTYICTECGDMQTLWNQA